MNQNTLKSQGFYNVENQIDEVNSENEDHAADDIYNLVDLPRDFSQVNEKTEVQKFADLRTIKSLNQNSNHFDNKTQPIFNNLLMATEVGSEKS